MPVNLGKFMPVNLQTSFQIKSEVTSLHRKKNKIHQFILDVADQILLEDKADAEKRKEKRKI